MSDILTQIQDELDMMLYMMQTGLAYVKERAPPSAPNGQPLLSSFAEYEASQAAAASTQAATQQTQSSTQQQTQTTTNPSQPTQTTTTNATQETPAAAPATGTISIEQLNVDIKEMSYDLVLKEQQLEHLIKNLPGIGSSERQQVERMKELERQLEEIEGDRESAVKEKDELVRRVERGIMSISGI